MHPLLPPLLLSVEPPDHTRYRRTVASVFIARAVSALQERIESAAVELIEDLDGTSGVDLGWHRSAGADRALVRRSRPGGSAIFRHFGMESAMFEWNLQLAPAARRCTGRSPALESLICQKNL